MKALMIAIFAALACASVLAQSRAIAGHLLFQTAAATQNAAPTPPTAGHAATAAAQYPKAPDTKTQDNNI